MCPRDVLRILPGCPGPLGMFKQFSGKKKAHTLKKILGTLAWCPTPGTPGGTNRGLPAGVLRIPCCSRKKLTEKGIFARTPAGCPTNTRPSRRFSEILCDFLLFAFLCSLTLCEKKLCLSAIASEMWFCGLGPFGMNNS